MKEMYPENWPQFYTATIQGWKHILKEDSYKNVIIEALKFLTENKKVKVNAFVIMDNHVHFIWQALFGYDLKIIQTSFKKHTSKQFIKLLKADKNLEKYHVNKIDREHHIWKRNSLGVELFTEQVFLQKLNYIHNNPIRAGLCKYAEEYEFSSALYYLNGIDKFSILEHYNGE